MFIAQPTLSQQIRRLEEIVGTPLLQRRREGLRLTAAGTVLLDASRNVLSLVDHEVSRTRQAVGLGWPRLRVVVPPRLPDGLAVETASALRSAPSPPTWRCSGWRPPRRRVLGDLAAPGRRRPGMADHQARGAARPARRDGAGGFRTRGVGLFVAPGGAPREDQHRGAVVHGSRRAEAGTYDAWTRVLRVVNPRFEFTDPPFRHSLPMALAFAATADRSTALLTGAVATAGTSHGLIRLLRPAATHDMVRVGLDRHALSATAALVWNGDLPRPLQQILFQTADAITPELAAIGLLAVAVASRRRFGID
jgi:DNA-binding transcriptional LysR family regulator